jgi:thiamine-phosphate pyrophosphorylase
MRPPRPVPLDLYLVTDRRLSGPRGVEAMVAAAVRGGVTSVQLRDDDTPTPDLVVLARRLEALLGPSGVPMIVNNRLDVALEVDADGVHVGQADTPVDEVRAQLGSAAILGLSITDPAQLAAVDPGGVDYLGVGPVFATGTKPDAAPAMGLDGLRACRRAAGGLPIVAIGGINATNAAEVVAAGADGVAVVSALCAADDPAAVARHLASVVREAKRA